MRNRRLRVIRRGLPFLGALGLLVSACGDGGSAAPAGNGSPAGSAGSPAGGAAGNVAGSTGGPSGAAGNAGGALAGAAGAASGAAGAVAMGGAGAGGGSAGFTLGTGGSFSEGGAAGQVFGFAGKAGQAGKAGGGGASGGDGKAGAAGVGPNAGAAGVGGASSGKPGDPCKTDGECSLAGIATEPPGCAEAFCGGGFCAVRARDEDKDGGRTKLCKPASGTTVEIAVGTDCDDGDPYVHAGAAEVCAVTTGPIDSQRDKDDDCDGEKDEQPAVGSLTWLYDGDGDGYADQGTNPVLSCAAPGPKWVTGIPQLDCNDQDPQVHPGRSEDCSTKADDNCNGSPTDGCDCLDAVDPPKDCGTASDCVYVPGGSTCQNGKYTACPPPIAKQLACADVDGDKACVKSTCLAYCPSVGGSSTQPVTPPSHRAQDQCEPGNDCNDTTASVAPGKLELCGDGIDNDCDGALENGYGVGTACDRETGLGACKLGGVRGCDTPTTTKCNTPKNATIPSSAYQAQAAPNGSYDWDCNGTAEAAIAVTSGAGCGASTFVRGATTARAFCVEKQTPSVAPAPNTPAPWGNADCVHPSLGNNERLPTCGELPLATCENHYYFTSCRDFVASPPTVSCQSPCGKTIKKLECVVQAGACVAAMPMACGGPTLLCR